MDGELLEPEYGGKRPIFDMRITLGSVIQILVITLGMMWWAFTQSGRIAAVEQAQAVQTTSQVLINGKLDTIDSKITDLAISVGRDEQRLEDYRK